MILEKLQSLIADQLGVDGNTITMDTNFEEDLGVDSLDIVELSMALEEEFDIGEMSEEDLAGIKTVGSGALLTGQTRYVKLARLPATPVQWPGVVC